MFDYRGFPRIDLSPIRLPVEKRIEVSKTISEYRRVGKQNAKPSECVLCKVENPSLCNSHSIPQFCLREIALDGKLKTYNNLIGIDLLSYSVGINSAGTFRMICRDCDNEFFSDYERPMQYEQGGEVEQKLLGEIATKVCLHEQYKAREQVAAVDRAYEANGIAQRLSNFTDARNLDLVDDAIQLEYAIGVVKGEGGGFRLLFDALLEYTVPIAFQGQVVLQSDFQGKMVNDIYNFDSDYHMEPIYICIFPLHEKTRVLLFCRDAGYARYSKFHRGLKSRNQNAALLSILKVLLGCSEELYFSPLLPDSVFENNGMKKMARMNALRASFVKTPSLRRRKKAYAEFAIDDMPNPPALFRREYCMAELRKARGSVL